jgi:glycine cleavage system H protein
MTDIEGFDFRPELYYINHVWAKVDTDGSVRVGFDDFVAKGAKDIYYIKIAEEGTKVAQKGKLGIIETRKFTGPITSPVSGVVIASNPEVPRKYGHPFKVDPYGEGWLVVIKPSKLEEELKNLMKGETALEWFKREIEVAKHDISYSPV